MIYSFSYLAPPEKENALIVSEDLMLELDRMNICICREAIDKSEGWLLRQEFQTLQALSLICQKQDQELTVAQTMNSLLPNSD